MLNYYEWFSPILYKVGKGGSKGKQENSICVPIEGERHTHIRVGKYWYQHGIVLDWATTT